MTTASNDFANQDTIFALSSGTLPSGVAVVRLSGPSVRFVLETIAGRVLPPRQAQLISIRRLDGSALDTALVLFFPGPASFTGEDVAELHLHGSRAVVVALFEDLSVLQGCRHAEPGEFTRRAFSNGKLDLLAAEAAADLISAETEAQRRFAVTAASGQLAAVYDSWRQRILDARALIEAELDFSDQDDIGDGVSDAVWEGLRVLAVEMHSHLGGYSKAEILRDGYRVVLVGAPNAGKSSLLNALAKRDVAIVTDEAGTTRDALDVRLDLDGHVVILTDTAGLRNAASKAEQLGVERSLERARAADLVVEIIDASATVFPPTRFDSIRPDLRVGTKSDLVRREDLLPEFDLVVSSQTGEGIEALLSSLSSMAAAAAPSQGELLPWRQRHVELLSKAVRHVDHALDGHAPSLELRAEELRLAGDAIGRIAGRVDVEDLLGAIFSRFCVGK